MKLLIKFTLLFFLLANTQPTLAQEDQDETTKKTTEASSEENKADDENKDEDESSESSSPKSSVEKIEVTGSYIKRIDVAGPTPLVTIDKEAFAVTGSQTVSDALKEKSYFDGVSSEAFINFHGQSEADTLVLLNGMRLPKTAGSTAVNIDFIPNSAVEKIEILKDGASALYGSEALAGVMNVVTKKDYDGASFDIRHTYPEIGKNQESNVVGSYGNNFSNGNFLAVIQYRDTEPLLWSDLGAGIKDTSVAGTNYGFPGNINSAGAWNRSADCPAGSVNASGFCGYDYLGFRNFASGTDKQHLSALTTARYDFGEELSAKFTAVYTKRKWRGQSNPTIMQFNVPQAVANSWAAGGRIVDANGAPAAFGADGVLRYSAEEELGPVISERDVNSYVVQAGLSGYFGDTWSWNFDAAYGLTEFRDDTISGQANEQGVQDRITANTFNPFKPAGSKDSLEDQKLQRWFEHKSDNTDIKLVTAGELYDLANLYSDAGPISMAVGTEATWESFSFTNDPLSLAGVPIGVSEANQEGKRNVQSGFIEFTAYPMQQLEIQLAGRFDQYSDVGSTFNPKVAASYKLNKKVLLRSSYGTGFKAPDLLSVNRGATSSNSTFRDETICQANGEADPDCNAKAFVVNSAGNKQLKPETAYHINLGTVIQPTDQVSFAIDYWQANGKDGLSSISASTATQWQYRFGDQFVRDLGIIIDRDGSNNITNFFLPSRVNSGEFVVKGIDVAINVDFSADLPLLGKVKGAFSSEHTQSLRGGSSGGAGAPFVVSNDIGWKNTSAVSLIKDKNLYRFAARTISGGDKDTDNIIGIGRGSIPTVTMYDFHYQYSGDWGGKITLGVKNLLDSALPANDLDGFYIISSSNFNPVGRRFYLGYGHEF